VFNIQKAVSRLNFAPASREIRITDIKNGMGEFVPRTGQPVSFAALKETLKKAGYTLPPGLQSPGDSRVKPAIGGW